MVRRFKSARDPDRCGSDLTARVAARARGSGAGARAHDRANSSISSGCEASSPASSYHTRRRGSSVDAQYARISLASRRRAFRGGTSKPGSSPNARSPVELRRPAPEIGPSRLPRARDALPVSPVPDLRQRGRASREDRAMRLFLRGRPALGCAPSILASDRTLLRIRAAGVLPSRDSDTVRLVLVLRTGGRRAAWCPRGSP